MMKDSWIFYRSGVNVQNQLVLSDPHFKILIAIGIQETSATKDSCMILHNIYCTARTWYLILKVWWYPVRWHLQHMAFRSPGALCLVESWGGVWGEISTSGPRYAHGFGQDLRFEIVLKGLPSISCTRRQQMVKASNADLPCCSFCEVIGASLLAAWSSKYPIALHCFGWIMHSWLYRWTAWNSICADFAWKVGCCQVMANTL